jgi:hypothetical protein
MEVDTEEIKVPRAYRFGDWSRSVRGSPQPGSLFWCFFFLFLSFSKVLSVRVPREFAALAEAAARKGFYKFSAWLKSQSWAQPPKQELECSAISSVSAVDPLMFSEGESIALNPHELLEGDIIVVTDLRDRQSLVNRIITTAHHSQTFLFGHGQGAAVHAAIVGKDCLIDVTGKGCQVKPIPDKFPFNVCAYRMIDSTKGKITKIASQVALEAATGTHHEEVVEEERPEEYFDAELVNPFEKDKEGDPVKYSIGSTARSIAFPTLFSSR